MRLARRRPDLDVVDEGTAAMLVGWFVLGLDGQAIPFPNYVPPWGVDSALFDTLPPETFDAISEAASDILLGLTGGPDPKAASGSSDGSPAVPPSPSTPSSPRPTSSPIIRVGPGMISNGHRLTSSSRSG